MTSLAIARHKAANDTDTANSLFAYGSLRVNMPSYPNGGSNFSWTLGRLAPARHAATDCIHKVQR
jgi:hypothetical protein